MSYNITVCRDCSDGILTGKWSHLRKRYREECKEWQVEYKAAQQRISKHAPLEGRRKEKVNIFWHCDICEETMIFGEQHIFTSGKFAKTTKMIKRVPEESKLQKHVRCWINRTAREYETGVEGVLYDLKAGGCIGGFVSHLIWYEETGDFYEKYAVEISALIGEVILCTGCEISKVLSYGQWDSTDPLAAVEWGHNRNLLAWWAFEETAKDICRNAGVKLICAP